MSYDIQVRRAAELEVAEAELWYEAQQVGIGSQFLSEVSYVLERIAENPLIYQITYRDIRRALVPRFPYLIWYRVIGKTAVIIACTHARQDSELVKARQ